MSTRDYAAFPLALADALGTDQINAGIVRHGDTTMNTKQKSNPLTEQLQATIERTEQLHAEIFERDKPVGKMTMYGPRWSEAILLGHGFDNVQAAAREAVNGLWSPCAREIGGCGGCGWKGGNEERLICVVCGGAGRILSAAGLELLRVIVSALSPQPKADATPEAIAAHNMRAAQAREARETAERERDERARQERAVLGEAAAKLAALRGPDPTKEAMDLEIARKHLTPTEAK